MLESLRRWPDIEAPNLVAVDATDRLLLDKAAEDIRANPDGVLVVDDNYGALTLGAIALGARGVLVHQDSIVGERALAANAGGLADYRHEDLDDRDSLAGVRVVLWQLPRSLDRVADVAWALAGGVSPDATVYAGGRIKHMTLRINEVLKQHFASLDVLPARQKSRALRVANPIPSARSNESRGIHTDLGIQLHGAPGVFAGGLLDIGARAMLEVLDEVAPAATSAVDLGCGSGILAITLAQARPHLHITATDVSAAAVRATEQNVALNGVTTITALQDDAGSSIPDASVDLVLLNPPFHTGSTVHTGIASKLFAAAARILKPGGELWTVYNSHLGYRAELARAVGPTREVSRNRKFTVTASTRR
ncbi:16S rRNA (guanine1207-N2)-methyltransferase [Leifsonia sp. AK011]|uniref:class I SAM-dependent methyltransferase n=1 Tax=Leifsonia sp. AK011 TaxID=2723075 RepID=UPI0017C369F4|nr:methyltransferase [Leifsonia sp. AK011]NYF09396.1 16S rRNA (guanine1207-N2)-methyltransferase [Leifsonia sp. AK011]